MIYQNIVVLPLHDWMGLKAFNNGLPFVFDNNKSHFGGLRTRSQCKNKKVNEEHNYKTYHRRQTQDSNFGGKPI